MLSWNLTRFDSCQSSSCWNWCKNLSFTYSKC